MNIHLAIRYLRKKKNWTQQQLAEFANTSKSNISNLENGNQGFSPAILEYLSRAFDCPIWQIFLLAEYINEDGEPNELWKQAPLDALLLQLPHEIQVSIRHLVLQLSVQYQQNLPSK